MFGSLIVATIWAIATGLLLAIALVVTFWSVRKLLKGRDDYKVPYLEKAGCKWYEGKFNGCKCLTKIPHQWFNTYSNVSFAVLGTFSAFYFANQSSIGLVFMFSMMVLCISSALFHGLPTRWSGHLDVAAIYFVFGGLVILALSNIVTVMQGYEAELMLLCGLLLSATLRMVFENSLGRLFGKVAILLGITYGATFLKLWPFRWNPGLQALLGSLVVFGVAFILQRVDVRKSKIADQNNKESPIWRTLHATWHVLASIGTCALFYSLLYVKMNPAP